MNLWSSSTHSETRCGMSRVKLATVPVGMSTAVPTAMPAATGPTPGLPPTTAPATGPAPGLSTAAVQKATRSLGNRELALAAVFSSHMVLQRRAPIAVFGTGKPGSTVTVTLAAHGAMSIIQVAGTSVDQISVSCTIADTGITSTDITSTGVWHLSLPPVERAAPCTLTVTDRRGNALTLDDVLVGEVWVAAGQSNMEYILLNDAEAEQTIAGSDDARLRFVNIAKSGVVDDALLQAERESSWQVCSPQSSANMSAVAYYCAAMLRRRLEGDVPVGIVDCYVGGTSVSCWMSEHTLSSSEAGRGYLDRYHAAVAGKSAEQMHRDMDAWSAAFNAWNDAIARARVERPASAGRSSTPSTVNARGRRR